jgi:hypothetical protein
LSVSNFEKNKSFKRKQIDFHFQNLKPCGLADLTASTASEAVAHISIWRNDFFLVSAATSTIAQIRCHLN